MDQIEKYLETIDKMESGLGGGIFIYRGEDRHYEKVTSGIHRLSFDQTHLTKFANRQNLDGWKDEVASTLEQAYLNDAESWIDTVTGRKLISVLQHSNIYKTNQIDFTRNPLIAFWFACNGAFDEDGRIILLRRSGDDDVDGVDGKVWKPKEPIRQTGSQESIFLSVQKGFFVPQHIITIYARDKKDILNSLEKQHGINKEFIYSDDMSLYGDLEGFAKNQERRRDTFKETSYKKFIDGYTKVIKSSCSDQARSKAYSDRALAYLSRGEQWVANARIDIEYAIQYDPRVAGNYVSRGLIHLFESNYLQASQDFSAAIDLRPDLADAYVLRAKTYALMGKIDKVVNDIAWVTKMHPGSDIEVLMRKLHFPLLIS